MKPENLRKILKRTEPLYFHGNNSGRLGVFFAIAALDYLAIEEPKHRELMLILETPYCFANTVKEALLVQLEDIEIKPYGKRAFTVINKRDGRAVRVSETPALRRELEKLYKKTRELQEKGKKDAAGIYAGKFFKALFKKRPLNLVKATPVEIDKEKVLRRLKSTDYDEIICAKCGESVLEPWARTMEGRFYCIPCYESFYPRVDQELENEDS